MGMVESVVGGSNLQCCGGLRHDKSYQPVDDFRSPSIEPPQIDDTPVNVGKVQWPPQGSSNSSGSGGGGGGGGGGGDRDVTTSAAPRSTQRNKNTPNNENRMPATTAPASFGATPSKAKNAAPAESSNSGNNKAKGNSSVAQLKAKWQAHSEEHTKAAPKTPSRAKKEVQSGHLTGVMDKLLDKSASAATTGPSNVPSEVRRLSIGNRSELTNMVDRVLKSSLPDPLPPGKRKNKKPEPPKPKVVIQKRSKEEYEKDERVRARRASLEATPVVAHRRRASLKEIASLTTPKCLKCGKSAYPAESVSYDNDVWHKSCFRCCSCNGSVSLTALAMYKKDVYHKNCFTQIFNKGGYNAFNDRESIAAQAAKRSEATAEAVRGAAAATQSTPQDSGVNLVARRASAFKPKTAEQLKQEDAARVAASQAKQQELQAALPKIEQEQRTAAMKAVKKHLERRKSIEAAHSLEDKLKIMMGVKPKNGSGGAVADKGSVKHKRPRKKRSQRRGRSRPSGGFKSTFSAGPGSKVSAAGSITLTSASNAPDAANAAEQAKSTQPQEFKQPDAVEEEEEEEEEKEEEEEEPDVLNLNNTQEFMKATPAERTAKYKMIVEALRTKNASEDPEEHVTTFTCTAADLDNEFCDLFAEFLKTDNTLEEVNLESNLRISPKGIATIAKALEGNTKLHTLKLMNTTQGTVAAEALTWLVDVKNPNRNKTLRKITFQFNQIQHKDRCRKGLDHNHKIYKGWIKA